LTPEPSTVAHQEEAVAATSSISGLASGLDTASIIDQLMQLEAVPQTQLKTKQTTEKSVVTALQSLNTDASLLAGKADTLAKPGTWQTLKGTASGSGVSVAVGSTASAGSFTVTVDKVALSHQVAFTNPAALTDVVVSGPTARITGSDGVPHDIDTGGGTLQELVAAINGSSATTGVGATAIKVADGSYRLITESTKTGQASAFTLTNTDNSALLGGTAVRTGADAQISLGLGITATSSTNTFTDITPGVSLTIAATATIGSTSTVQVAQDSSGVSTSVSALVDQLNAMLTSIDTQSAIKTSTTAAGVLVGNGTARDLRNALLNTVFGNGTSSMASLGIQTDRTGMLVFDSAAFAKAYAADPAGVAAKFTTGATTADDGWAARVATVAKAASNSTTGTITSAITGRNSSIDRLTKDIEDWDTRLELRKTSLERTYTALETALSTLKAQGTWLTSQIDALSSSS
jgi:flagellar hook-associated protein 2